MDGSIKLPINERLLELLAVEEEEEEEGST